MDIPTSLPRIVDVTASVASFAAVSETLSGRTVVNNYEGLSLQVNDSGNKWVEINEFVTKADVCEMFANLTEVVFAQEKRIRELEEKLKNE